MEVNQKKNYFKPEETACKCGCGFQITPELLDMLNQLREKCGHALAITSGARCEKHNKAVGGVPLSKHLEGIAVDISANGGDLKYEVIKHAMELGFSGIGIHPLFVHVDLRKGTKLVWDYTKLGG